MFYFVEKLTFLTQLAPHVPVKLGVEIGWVDAIRRGINSWQLPLVESQELFGSVIDQRLGPGLTEWQNISRSTYAASRVKCEGMITGRRFQQYQFVFVEVSESWHLYLHSDTLVRQQSWWRPPGLTDPCSVSLSSSSSHPWNNCQRTGDEMREESERDHMKINETGVASIWRPEHYLKGQRASGAPTQDKKTM